MGVVPLGVDVAGVDPGASTGGGGGLGTRPGGAGGGRLVLPPPESFSLSRSLSLSRSPLSRSGSLSRSRFRLGALPLVRERPAFPVTWTYNIKQIHDSDEELLPGILKVVYL